MQPSPAERPPSSSSPIDGNSGDQSPTPIPTSPSWRVDDTRVALPQIAAAFHDHPAQKLTVIGVTGTDGKSTTTYLTYAMLTAAGHQTGLLNGVEFHIGGEWSRNETGETTPEADIIQARLAEMVAAGDTHAVLEVSSHGLELHRADLINTQVAVFTGLSDDHLDFHETREQYFAAKLKLFQSLDAHPNGQAVVRAEDDHREAIVNAHRSPNDDCHRDAQYAVRSQHPPEHRRMPPARMSESSRPPEPWPPDSHCPATTTSVTPPSPPAPRGHSASALSPCRRRSTTSGRSPDGWNPSTPDNRSRSSSTPPRPAQLSTSRCKLSSPTFEGRLILVFGVAGERDPIRKYSMAAAAAAYADHTVITNENPRSEDPVEMVEEIARASCSDAGGLLRSTRNPTARQAIRRAISLAQPDDLVLIAGKGAEPTMIYADRDRALGRPRRGPRGSRGTDDRAPTALTNLRIRFAYSPAQSPGAHQWTTPSTAHLSRTT